MGTTAHTRRATAASAILAASLVLTACGEGGSDSDEEGGGRDAAAQVRDPLVLTYDGGLYVLDGKTLELAEDVELEGYNRVNPAGDDSHVMVSTSQGFRVLNAAEPQLTDVRFKGSEPGHVVTHAGRTALFTDGTGEVRVFDSKDLGDGKPQSRKYTTPSPHHGVAVELENGELVTTDGTEDKRETVRVLDKDNKEVERSDNCPEVHGEATAKDETVVIGCEDGVLVYKDGEFDKVKSPDDYGRIGNQQGSEKSPIVLGDYKKDPEAELERPEEISLIDTEKNTMELVDLGTSYTFQSLARGPKGEALVLGTDGKVHIIDPEKGEVVDRVSVLDEWREPLDWQQARPTLFVRGGTAYVTDPEQKRVHAIDLSTGKKKAGETLPKKPNELTGVDG